MRINSPIILIILSVAILQGSDERLPGMQLKDLSNHRVNLDQYYERTPILINFWTLACDPCKKEMKFLNDFNTKYEDTGFQVISVNMDNPRSMSKVKSYVKSQDYSFTVLSDPKSELFQKTGGRVMPYILMINTDGTIQKRHIGFTVGDEKDIERDILDLIQHNTMNTNEKR